MKFFKETTCKNLLILLTVLCFASCATLPKPETPRQMLASTSVLIGDMANTIDLAESRGDISEKTEDDLLDELQKAVDNMNLANTALTVYEVTGEGAGEVDRRILQAEAVLALVERMLEAEQ